MHHTIQLSASSPLVRGGLLGLGFVTSIACANVNADPNPSTRTSLPYAEVVRRPPVQRQAGPTLQFEWAAVNLAAKPPYDTAQLHAVLRTPAGAIIPNTSPVEYITPDTEAIHVSSTGLVTAYHPIPLAHVIARVTQDGQMLTDTARIQVTKDTLPAPLASVSIQPQGGGITSARGNLNNSQFTMPIFGTIPFFATIAKGNPNARERICSAMGCRKYPILVHFTSSDPSIAYIDDETGMFHPLRTGRVTFTVSTVAYGVRKLDSLPFSVGYNQRTETFIDRDTTHHPSVLLLRHDAHYLPPYSVGLRIWVHNFTDEPFEVSFPKPAHGVHFVDGSGDQPRVGARDTLTVQHQTAAVALDSAGTYALQYRGLKTGQVFSDTLTLLPYP